MKRGRLFVDQECRVRLVVDRPGNEVRITFNETNEPQTLALSAVKAAHLALDLLRLIPVREAIGLPVDAFPRPNP